MATSRLDHFRLGPLGAGMSCRCLNEPVSTQVGLAGNYLSALCGTQGYVNEVENVFGYVRVFLTTHTMVLFAKCPHPNVHTPPPSTPPCLA